MRWLALVFVVLIVALQYPMWLGKGGWLQVRELDRQLSVQREANARLKARNDRLDADVGDLKTGYEAIEDRARSELGMVRQDEVFFQMQSKPGAAPAADVKAGAAAGSTEAGSTAQASGAAPSVHDGLPPNAVPSASVAASASPAQAGSASGMISPVSAPVTEPAAGGSTRTPKRAHAATEH